jgi:Tfp pilus assembly protein PilF
MAARNAGNIRQGIALYEALQRRFPSSEEAAVSHVSLARLLLDHAAQPKRALVHYQIYLSRHSQGVLAEEALAGASLAAAKQGNVELAASYRNRLRARFPGSIHLQEP